MKTIAIIGAGMMGSAMSIPAREGGHEVRLVGTPLDRDIISHAGQSNQHLTMKQPLPEGVLYYQFEEAEKALRGADLVIGGVSSFGIDWFAREAVPLIPAGLPVLMVTKGLALLPDGKLEAFPRLLSGQTGQRHPFCAVGGPCTSYELAQRQHSSVVFCGEDIAALRLLRETLRTDYYHISLSKDVMGVECAVAMKNAYALAVCLAVGLHEQAHGKLAAAAYNPQAALFAQSVREIRRMLKLLGGGDENIVYAAGDLYVTVFGGRTRKLGILLGQGLGIREALAQLEGITLESAVIAKRTAQALRALAHRGQADISGFPLLMHIGDLLEGKTRVNIPWESFETEEM